MAFKANTVAAEQAFTNLRRQAAATKRFLADQRTLMQAATCEAQVAINVVQHCGITLGLMDEWAETPGIAEHARAQFNDGAYDIVAEYQAMRAALVELRDGLMGMFPKNENDFLLYHSFAADGKVQARSFTAAQLAAAVRAVTSALATID
jgi:hypothetical protein